MVDSSEAKRFKAALCDNFDFVQRSAIAGKSPIYTALNIQQVVNDVVASIDPKLTIPRYVLGQIKIPQRHRGRPG